MILSSFIARDELVDALKAHSQPVDCTEGRLLFRQGEEPSGLNIQHVGEVTITAVVTDGQPDLELVAQPRSLLGLPAVISKTPYPHSATASSGADVTFIPRERFFRIVEENPGIGMMVLGLLATEARAALRTMKLRRQS